MGSSRHLSFAFSGDGQPANGPAAMTVTYVGRIARKAAEADARRRFEEWQRQPNALARHWGADQVVVF